MDGVVWIILGLLGMLPGSLEHFLPMPPSHHFPFILRTMSYRAILTSSTYHPGRVPNMWYKTLTFTHCILLAYTFYYYEVPIAERWASEKRTESEAKEETALWSSDSYLVCRFFFSMAEWRVYIAVFPSGQSGRNHQSLQMPR